MRIYLLYSCNSLEVGSRTTVGTSLPGGDDVDSKGVYDEDENQHLSFTQGGGHGGSHPHLVNEFLQALAADRDPFPNAPTSANWTSVGILAHESALQGGKIIEIPKF